MKANPLAKKEERNIRVYELWKRGAYTYAGLGRLFRISEQRVFAIVKAQKEKEKSTFTTSK